MVLYFAIIPPWKRAHPLIKDNEKKPQLLSNNALRQVLLKFVPWLWRELKKIVHDFIYYYPPPFLPFGKRIIF